MIEFCTMHNSTQSCAQQVHNICTVSATSAHVHATYTQRTRLHAGHNNRNYHAKCIIQRWRHTISQTLTVSAATKPETRVSGGLWRAPITSTTQCSVEEDQVWRSRLRRASLGQLS